MAPARILVANRGEIAVRILSSARELGLHTIAVWTEGDDAHAAHAHEAVQLPSASSYMDPSHLVSVCREHHVDLVHPGYGFLSESPGFCRQLKDAGVAFVGPSADLLASTGDKLSARRLAEECGVPVLPALTEPAEKVEALRAFANDVGFPIMIKAVDGGGGRGIRLVRRVDDLEPSFLRAVNESPSSKVFTEKAAVDGFRHIEVQVIGDGKGNVRHFWERECSIQRRFQKVVEIAPSTVTDRTLIASVIEAAVRMARAIKYQSLGTWEFLVSPENSRFYFMEINPRLQVEHTITEAICGVDLVRWQLLIALGKSFPDIRLETSLKHEDAEAPPSSTSVQLRITAEDVKQNFSLSIGRVRGVLFPGGNGVRLDTHLRPGVMVSTDFDSLLAKLIVTSSHWDGTVAKAERALQDVLIDGVTTNLSLLLGIVRSADFRNGHFDTQWLERHLDTLNVPIRELSSSIGRFNGGSGDRLGQSSAQPSKSSGQLVRKGDQFQIQIEGSDSIESFEDLVSITSVIRNDFPESLAVKLSTFSTNDPGGLSNNKRQKSYTVRILKQSETQKSLKGPLGHSKATRGDSSQLISPIAGQVVELLIEEGEVVSEGDAVLVIRQMKMELEVRAHRSGAVRSLVDLDDGDSIAVGTTICSIVPVDREKL
ncbi:putative carboxylase:pyruvate acetylpropionyl [Diaporthe ampelina]|uniref:Putative carboxylase:pyruvate acetylpropionyl n=1 Tax=Diaporthe ampelina TaxID=1214573 RepID=A0A0G2FZY4_9PEZI|nr:putative carboxylase:pyruvate acetylpropionyl [Diaporthe ampelina]